MIQSRRTSKAGGICAMGEEEAGQSSTFLRRLEKGQNILRFIFFSPTADLKLNHPSAPRQGENSLLSSPSWSGLDFCWRCNFSRSSYYDSVFLRRASLHSCTWPDLREYMHSKAYPCTSATSYRCNSGSGARMLLQLKRDSFYTSPAEVVP